MIILLIYDSPSQGVLGIKISEEAYFWGLSGIIQLAQGYLACLFSCKAHWGIELSILGSSALVH